MGLRGPKSLVELNDHYRVAEDPLLWIVACHKDKSCRRISHPTTREVLLRTISEKGTDATTEAIAYIETWPEHHHVYGKKLPVLPRM